MCRALFTAILSIALNTSMLVARSEAQISSSAIGSVDTSRNAKYGLSGTVINSLTGEPIRRALVQLYDGGQRSVFTDQDGRFQFNDLAQTMGTSLSARKPGFFTEQELAQNSLPQKMVEVGPNATPVVLKLVPEAVITGHVHGVDGEPLENMPIKISYFRMVNGRRQWEQRGGASTNEDGEFRIANLTPGKYYVAAGPSWNRNLMQAGQAPGDEAYPATYFPAARELSAATPIHLAPGQHPQTDFPLKPATAFLLSGTITGYSPAQGVDLQVIDSSGQNPAFSTRLTPQTGQFRIRVVSPGMCILKAHAYAAQQENLYGEIALNVVANLSAIHIELTPALAIPIAIRREERKPQPASSVVTEGEGSIERLTPSNIPISVHLISTDRLHPDAWSSVEAAPDNPLLAVRNVEPGKYKVEITSFGLWYVQSIARGDADLFRDDLIVTPGQEQPIEIVLRDDAATLAGTVQQSGGSSSGSQATVILVADRAPLNPRIAQANERGDFEFSGLAPGEYKAFAFDHVDGLEYANPEALRDYDARASSIVLQPEQQATVKINLIRREE